MSSSSNNAAPDNTVINVENNDAIPIPNQNQSSAETRNHPTTESANVPSQPPSASAKIDIDCLMPEKIALFFILLFYGIWLIVLFYFGIYNIFPILILLPISSLTFAYIGAGIECYQLLIPFAFTTACEIIYSIICFLFLISCRKKRLFYDFIIIHWPETAKKFEIISNGDSGKVYFFILYFSIWISAIFFILVILFILFEFKKNKKFISLLLESRCLLWELRLQHQTQISELQENNRAQSEQRLQHRTQIYALNRELNIQRTSNQQLQTRNLELRQLIEAQATENEEQQRQHQAQNPYRELLAQILPPPSYQSHPILSTPRTGLPPPDYSMLVNEEHQSESAPVTATQMNELHDSQEQGHCNTQESINPTSPTLQMFEREEEQQNVEIAAPLNNDLQPLQDNLPDVQEPMNNIISSTSNVSISSTASLIQQQSQIE